MANTLPVRRTNPAGILARPGMMNGDSFDRYTLGHLAAGVLLGLGQVPLPVTIGLAVGWEFAENYLKDAHPYLFPHPQHDSPRNATVDAAAVMLGYALMRALPPCERKHVAGPSGKAAP